MKYVLMNKDHVILELELDINNNSFTKILRKVSMEYAPLSLYNTKGDLLEELNYWYHRRYMPDYRLDFYDLLENLDLFELYDYHETYYSFNMSDHYWVKPIDSEMTYQDILALKNHILPNFFEAALFKKNHPLNTYADPNITTEGILPKAWINKGEKSLLYKGFLKTELEPYNEVLAYMIAQKLGMDAIEYHLEIIDGQVFSVCDNFIDEHLEIVSAEDIMNGYQGEYNLENYLRIVKEHGLDASKMMNDMYLLDYLIKNTDRHMHNFGILRDPDTLKWVRVCPLFDHGTSLLSNNESTPKYFQNRESNFPFILSLVDQHYDLSLLEEVFEEFILLTKAYPIEENKVLEMIDIVRNQIRGID